MSERKITIRNVRNYFKEFGIEAIGKQGMDKSLVRSQLLEAFRKEIFDQIVDKFGDEMLLAREESEVDPDTREKVTNILKNAVRKWKRLCIVFAGYKETHNVIMPDDLMSSMKEVIDAQSGISKIVKEEGEQ